MWAALPPVLLAALFFLPVTQHYFYADDFIHLFALADLDPLRFLLRPQAGHSNVTFNAVFAVTHALFGAEPAGYQWTSLVTHLVNVALLFALLERLFASERIACLGAAVWGVCPAHEATVGWYSVYGQTLATTLTLLVLLDVVRPGPVTLARAVRWGLLLLVGATCFGVGVGIAVVFPVVLWLLNPGAYALPATRRFLLAFAVLPVALYVGLHVLFDAAYGDEQSVALPFLSFVHEGWQPSAILLPQLVTAGLAWLGLGLVFPTGPYPGIAATTLIVLAVAGASATAGFGGPLARRRLGAFALLALGTYGTIALGRGFFLLVGQGIVALGETPRYHYLGGLALTLAGCVVFAWLGEHLPARWTNALLAAGLAGGIALVVTTEHQIDHHDAARTESEEVMATVRRLAADGTMGRVVSVPNRPFHAVGIVPPAIFPGWAGVFMIFEPTNVVDGRPIRFVGDARALAAGAPGGRLAALLEGAGTSRAR